MPPLFLRQFVALFWKNWIVLAKHPILNILRCFILPIGFGIFLAIAQDLFGKPNDLGIGTPAPIRNLADVFDSSLSLIWADGTSGDGIPSPTDIMSRITTGFSQSQLQAVKKIDAGDISSSCPQNYNGFSECFAAITFLNLPGSNGSDATPSYVQYAIQVDSGLVYINVVRHTSDYEERVLPLQWAIDQAIIELTTKTSVPTPLEWPFTHYTNSDQANSLRLGYIGGVEALLCLLFFVCYIGIAYQLPGAFSGERANSLTPHMKAMGLLDSARIISWHLSISFVYLPAWIIVALIWRHRIFTASNVGLILLVHLLLGLSLASWSLFVATPFKKSPQLAAVASTFLAILLAILALVFGDGIGTTTASVLSLVFPPVFYIYAIRVICAFEGLEFATNALQLDPDNDVRLLPLIVVAIIDIVLWPYLAVLLERQLYDPRDPSKSWIPWRKRKGDVLTMAPDVAISVKNLGKTFSTSMFRPKKGLVTAISDLTIEIPKFGIFVLVGANGAGKSTFLSILGGLIGPTRGSMTFAGGVTRPPRGTIGIVPQKNVLFPELSCYQTLRVWRAVKWSESSREDEDIQQLLRDCDLEQKIHANAMTLSGGQKRKLQLAIGLIGGSKIVLIDECTSGVDPLSRRALWRTLTSFRNDRTIVFTTHFLDEADFLSDNLAVLAAPGKLIAEGSPVTLKRSLGAGYSVRVNFTSIPASTSPSDQNLPAPATGLLQRICTIAPDTKLSMTAQHASYHLNSKDSVTVEKVLQLIGSERSELGISSYDVHGSSIEDIFLDLMHRSDQSQDSEKDSHPSSDSVPPHTTTLEMGNGRPRTLLGQALTIFHKRALIARRSWLSPLLTVAIAAAAACIPLTYMAHRVQTCTRSFSEVDLVPLYLPDVVVFGDGLGVVVSPPDVLSTLDAAGRSFTVDYVSDNATFVSTIGEKYTTLDFGGVSLDLSTGNSLVAWDADPPGINGPVMLNLATNILFNRALNVSGSGSLTIIDATLGSFPFPNAGTLTALRWVAFFGLAMSVFPAFYSFYVCKERRSLVQQMQFSNGLANPAGLWIGHLLFDSVFTIILSVIIAAVFATCSNQFHGLGFFWFLIVLYGIVGALFAYCASLLVVSPLAAFALVAGYQVVMFLLYIAAYLITLTYAKPSAASHIISIIHFTMSILAPVSLIVRASLVSIDLFSLLCSGGIPVTASSLGDIERFGGVLLYLIIYGFVLFGILVWVDSGSILLRLRRTPVRSDPTRKIIPDVIAEEKSVSNSSDPLRVLQVTKSFGGEAVVDDVSFGVSKETIFALLGPNGAGKTTIFNVIRGNIVPDTGDVFVNGVSAIRHPTIARVSLGVCPQFTAIDAQLTVKEHLKIYGRLKGLRRGDELERNVDSVMRATSLDIYADRLANKLSGGNQRKLSLAIALMGNPSVLLIDEFSTGIDAKMKRDMWITLRTVAVGKAVVITTHSMEEASALANKVGIVAKRMLSVDTTDNLSARYAKYEVHFACRNREDVAQAQQLMARIPGSRMADDVATRFEVPVNGEDGLSLAELFHILSTEGTFSEYTIEKPSLESVFLKVIRENNVLEEDLRLRSRWWKFWSR